MAWYNLVASGNWTNPSIWSPSGVPGVGDSVSLGSSSYTLTLNTDVSIDTFYSSYEFKGTVNFGSYNHTIGGMQVDGGTINLQNSTITTAKIRVFQEGGKGSVNAGTSTVIFNSTSDNQTTGSSSRKINLSTVYVEGGMLGVNNVTAENIYIVNRPSTSYIYMSSGGTLSLRKLVIKGSTSSPRISRLGSTGTGTLTFIGSNQITALNRADISGIDAVGSGKYYAGSNSTDGGNNSGFIFSDAPKVESFSDAFSGSSVDTTKWTASNTVFAYGGFSGVNSFGTTRTGTLVSKEQYLGEGSYMKFQQSITAGSSLIAYFANASSQYGVTARRNIPDIYVTLTDTTGQFFIKAASTYTSTTFSNSYAYYRIRESGGTIYLDGSEDGIAYTNIKSALASTYGLDTTQLIARPYFSFTSVGMGGSQIGAFNIEKEPTAVFSGTPVSGNTPLTVNFTDQSNFTPTSWDWDFGDGGTSTLQNPSHTYNAPGTYTVSLEASNSSYTRSATRSDYITVSPNIYTNGVSGSIVFSGSIARKIYATRSISGTLIFGGSVRAVLLRDVEGIQDKRYLYKVYDEEGNYIETWRDVVSELNYTHEINTIGSTTQIELARNSDTVGVVTSPILTEAGTNLLTEDDFDLLATTESKNQIGSGSSVEYNNRVDITVFYGSVEPLLTENDEPILTEDDEELLADIGAPNGRRIFTGFISEINSRYGSSETTLVQLTSYGWDLGQFPLTDETGKTTVTFNSYDPSDIAKEAVDKFVADSAPYNTYTTRDITSIRDTGTVVSYTFRANTYEDVVNKTLELMPANWYYRVGLGDNLVYYNERSATAKHLFYLGKHIKALDLRGSILNAVNRVLFTGGGDPALYIDREEAPADRTRRTLSVMSDNRVTVLDSAEVISEGQIEQGNKRQYRTTIEILARKYDIESINVGDTVGFRNFGNYVDGLIMQIVGLSYSPDSVQLQLETKPPTINKRLEDIRRNLTVTENQNVPDEPS